MSEDVVIEVVGLIVNARVGVSDEELARERQLVIDLSVRSAGNEATVSDSIEDTVDYAELAAIAAGVARSGPHRTLERLAAEILDGVAEFCGDSPMRVRVLKPDPPMPGRVHGVAVTLERGGGTAPRG